MAEKSLSSPPSERKTSSSPRPRTMNRLRKRFSKENKSSPNLLGVKIKRFSEFENYSGRSRGTLGGFSPLPDMSNPVIDSLSLEKHKNVEKECILTQLTKKIGLGIYTRSRDTASEKSAGEGYIDLDGDERETWYMFYPPPPSPSLALEPKDWESASSPEPDSVSSNLAPSVPVIISEADVDTKNLPRLSAVTQGSQYGASNPTSPVSPTDRHSLRREMNQNVDIDALILSAENLAEQYRGLLLTPEATPRLPSFLHPYSEAGRTSPLPFSFSSPSQLPSPLSFHPPTRPQTPKTLRKIKRQHSLRKLLDGANTTTNSNYKINRRSTLPSSTTPLLPTPLPQMLAINPLKIPTAPTPLTPPPSANFTGFTNPTDPMTTDADAAAHLPTASLFPPLTPPPLTLSHHHQSFQLQLQQLPPKSPDFLLRTFTPPTGAHTTRLSLAAHPNRSPTPSGSHGGARNGDGDAGRRRKRKRAREPPEPPPRQSSRQGHEARRGKEGGRKGGEGEGGKEKEEKEKRELKKGGQGDNGGGAERTEGDKIGDDGRGERQEHGTDRARQRGVRRHGISDMVVVKNGGGGGEVGGGGVNEGGEGWL